MKISDRLLTAKNMAKPNSTIWDLCCDHGLLGEQFVNESVDIFLVDRSPSIIKNLESKFGSTTMSVVCSSAEDLAPISGNCTAYIPGVGTKTIQKILLKHVGNKDIRWVLGTHKNPIELRGLLIDMGLKITLEEFVNERGRVREVLAAEIGEPLADLYSSSFLKRADLEQYRCLLLDYLEKTKSPSQHELQLIDSLKLNLA